MSAAQVAEQQQDLTAQHETHSRALRELDNQRSALTEAQAKVTHCLGMSNSLA